MAQLSEQPGRSVYIAFDQDENQAGQKASHQLAQRLANAGITAHIVQLPDGHDPNSYFVAGATRRRFYRPSAGGATGYEVLLVYRPSVPASASPYRLLDEHGREVAWANGFLDAQRVRQLSLRSLRAYAYDLLHFARWWAERPAAVARSPNPPCSTMPVTNWINNPNPRRKP